MIEQYYIGVNGELKVVKKKKFHYPVHGFTENNKTKFEDPTFPENVEPFFEQNWTDAYNPFRGAHNYS